MDLGIGRIVHDLGHQGCVALGVGRQGPAGQDRRREAIRIDGRLVDLIGDPVAEGRQARRVPLHDRAGMAAQPMLQR